MISAPHVVAVSLAIAGFAATTSAAAQPNADGERLFRARCASCHAISPGQNRIGPPLAGVFGRTAGSVGGGRVSDALAQSGIAWDGETLDAYLANPRQLVPGTSMTVALRNAGERTAIIGYLEGLATDN